MRRINRGFSDLLGSSAPARPVARKGAPRGNGLRSRAARTPAPAPPTPDVSPELDEELDGELDEELDEEPGGSAISLGDVARAAAGLILAQREPQQQATSSPRAQLLGEYQGLRAAGLTDAQAQSALRSKPKRRIPLDRAESIARLYSELEKRGGAEVDIPALVRTLVMEAKAEHRKMLPAPTGSQSVAIAAAPLGYGQPIQAAARPHAMPIVGRGERTKAPRTGAISYESGMRGPFYPLLGR